MKTTNKIIGLFGLISCIFCSNFSASAGSDNLRNIKTVFIIVLENEDWKDVQNSGFAPYINNVLLPQAGYCSQYFNPSGIHPSLPNYIWLEAGTNFGILDDNDPSLDHQTSTNHLVTLLNSAGVTWKAYLEDIPGDSVPLVNYNGYAVRHDPFAYFDDVTGTNNPDWAYGIAHIRPYTELAGDLASNTVAQYNFIAPNVCDDGHDSCAPYYNGIAQADTWLSTEIQKITNSAAYRNNGAIFITWDENDYDLEAVGLLALSPLVKSGYTSALYYTHSSTLRTMEEIFGVTPFLGDAANATDLSDLFQPATNITTNLPAGITFEHCAKMPNGSFQFDVVGASQHKTNLIQASGNLVSWVCVGTNVPNGTNFTFVDSTVTNGIFRFYRVVQPQ